MKGAQHNKSQLYSRGVRNGRADIISTTQHIASLYCHTFVHKSIYQYFKTKRAENIMIIYKKNVFLLQMLFGLLNIFKFDAFSEATDVFGGWDDRIQYYKLDDAVNEPKWAQNKAYFKELASGVCLITEAAGITSDAGSTTKSRLYLYGTLPDLIKEDGLPACDVLKFRDEFVIAGSAGTGSLIDNRKVLTAYHVAQSIEDGESFVCVFNYFKESQNSLKPLYDASKKLYYRVVNTSDIYAVTKVASGWVSSDWAVIELSRDASVNQKRLCYYKDSDIQNQIGVGQNAKELCALGYPEGMPLILTDDGRQTNATLFRTDLDLFSGNSGCPIFVHPNSDAANECKYKIIGICSAGGTAGVGDYVTVKQSDGGKVDNKPCDCKKENYRGDPSINGGVTAKIDQLYSKSKIANTNCSQPNTPKPETPKPTTGTQIVPGQNITLSYKPTVTGIHVFRLKYSSNGTLVGDQKTSNYISSDLNKIKTITYGFVPAGLNYNLVVVNPNGIEVVNTYGTANSSTTGPATVYAKSTNVGSMALVANASGYPYTSIQQAIDNSPSGYTLHISRGVYNENIVITKPITIIGEPNSVAMITTKSSSPAISIRANNVTIKNITCQSEEFFQNTGIQLDAASNCLIESNSLTGFSTPISLVNGSSNNAISSNAIHGAIPTEGIQIDNSTQNSFAGNTIDYGLSIFRITNCSQESNTFDQNSLFRQARLHKGEITPILNLLLD